MRPYPKTLPVLVFISIIIFSCNSKPPVISANARPGARFGKLEFSESGYSFGTIKSGDTVSHVFDFTNIGDAPLLIHDISTGCGCTVVEWPKQAIPVNGTSHIKVSFSKRHDPGLHTKTIVIKANTEDTYTVLHIDATVLN